MYENSIKKKDTLLWSKIINSGFVDTQKYKDVILEFYFDHSEEIDEDKKLKVKNTKKNNASLIEKEKQEAIQKTLEDEPIQKKVTNKEWLYIKSCLNPIKIFSLLRSSLKS